MGALRGQYTMSMPPTQVGFCAPTYLPTPTMVHLPTYLPTHTATWSTYCGAPTCLPIPSTKLTCHAYLWCLHDCGAYTTMSPTRAPSEKGIPLVTPAAQLLATALSYLPQLHVVELCTGTNPGIQQPRPLTICLTQPPCMCRAP
jgi:hypothetical protein